MIILLHLPAAENFQVDWTAVAQEVGVTNGHASRMRYSRFKQQMEGHIPTKRARNPENKRIPKSKKTTDEDSTDVKVKIETPSTHENSSLAAPNPRSSPIMVNTEAAPPVAMSMSPESPPQFQIKAEPMEEDMMPTTEQPSQYTPDLTDPAAIEYSHHSPDAGMAMQMLELQDQQPIHTTQTPHISTPNHENAHNLGLIPNQIHMHTPSMTPYNLPGSIPRSQLHLQPQNMYHPMIHGTGHRMAIGIGGMPGPQDFVFPEFYGQGMDMSMGRAMSENVCVNGGDLGNGNFNPSMLVKLENRWDDSYSHV
jgi:hypothetical protein